MARYFTEKERGTADRGVTIQPVEGELLNPRMIRPNQRKTGAADAGIAPPKRATPDHAGRQTGAQDVGVERLHSGLSGADIRLVDEAFRRGASVQRAMELLADRARVLDTMPRPRLSSAPFGTSREDYGTPEEGDPQTEQTERDYLERLSVRRIEALRPQVQTRYLDYVATVKAEFAALGAAKPSFAPSTAPPHVDPYATAEEKYMAMRAVYYRDGWDTIKTDILDKQNRGDFFGANIVGGVHGTMRKVLIATEARVKAKYPNLVVPRLAGITIGGFNPRFQAGSNVLSNHAFGLAIDIDPTWNPQIKSRESIKAIERATGEVLDERGLQMSFDSRKVYEENYRRLSRVSAKLKPWLRKYLPQYDQLQRDRKEAVAKKDESRTKTIDNELKSNPDLAATAALVMEFTRPTVGMWAQDGILLIPFEVIESFLAEGALYGARWGGDYVNSKDVMHLELLKVDVGQKIETALKTGKPRTIEDLKNWP